MQSVELYSFRAHYLDGDYLDETDEIGFSAIDLDRLVSLELIPNEPLFASACVQLTDEKRPIFFRRRKVLIDYETEAEVGRETITVLGYQETLSSGNKKSLMVFFDDGSLMLTDDSESF